MFVDLAQFKAQTLRISMEVLIGSPLWDELSRYCLTEEDAKKGFVTFGKVYSRRKEKHLALGAIHRLEESDKYLVLFAIYRQMVRRPPKGVASPLEMFQCLGKISAPQTLDCRIEFEYPANEYESTFGIPVAFPDSSNLPYNEIWGFHLAQVVADKVVYDAIVDQERGADLTLRIFFRYEAGFSSELPGEVFNKAVAIAASLVVSKKKELGL